MRKVDYRGKRKDKQIGRDVEKKTNEKSQGHTWMWKRVSGSSSTEKHSRSAVAHKT
jgi:hypothetical protein